ncbi:MAG: flavodoxin domain-containing protein [Salibacteraceae bacterium]
MKALIFYESFIGNTGKVAQAIADSLAPVAAVSAKAVGEFKPSDLQSIDWLIIGSSTRGFRPPSETQKFLSALKPTSLEGKYISPFATRIELDTIKSSLFHCLLNTAGYAAKSIARTLVKKGGVLNGEPQGFSVLGKEDPLVEGELEHAHNWVKTLIN